MLQNHSSFVEITLIKTYNEITNDSVHAYVLAKTFLKHFQKTNFTIQGLDIYKYEKEQHKKLH